MEGYELEPKIIGESQRLRLRIAAPSDLDFIMASEAEAENAKYIIADSREMHAATIDSPEGVHIVAEKKSTGAPVGFIMALSLDSPHNEEEWRRVIINERGEGYGQEMLAVALRWAFETNRAHRVWLDCMDDNPRALHAYESAGFRREGLIRETILSNGVYKNLFILAILDWEWRKMNRR